MVVNSMFYQIKEKNPKNTIKSMRLRDLIEDRKMYIFTTGEETHSHGNDRHE